MKTHGHWVHRLTKTPKVILGQVARNTKDPGNRSDLLTIVGLQGQQVTAGAVDIPNTTGDDPI